MVVPASSTRPTSVGPEDVDIPFGRYWSFSSHCWVKTAMVTTVSHTRLDLLFRNGRRTPSEYLTEADMRRVETALKFALNLP